MASKERLDVLVQERGLAPTRSKAQALIMAGEILVNDVQIDKCGTKVETSAQIRMRHEVLPFVSRGGLKLEHAFKVFPIAVEGKTVCDLGASTGGFVDCALQHGAKKVYAVDVGYGQLAWSLRQDPRVVNLEKTNARYLSEESLSEQVDWVTTDVAFISLCRIFPAAAAISTEEAQMIALIKPQFEAGPEKVGKNGVVRDPLVHCEVIERVIQCAALAGFSAQGLEPSPIRGPKGNIEYLLWLAKKEVEQDIAIASVVEKAFSQIQKEKTDDDQ